MDVEREGAPVSKTEPAKASPGWRMTGERPLTPEETATLRTLQRRYHRCAILSGIGTPIAFFCCICGIAEASTLVRDANAFWFCVLVFGPMILMGLCYVWMSDNTRRDAGLRRDLKRGTAVQYQGTLRWAVLRAEIERRLLREGRLLRRPDVPQTVEVLPEAHILWSANGTATARVRFEAEPIALPLYEEPVAEAEPSGWKAWAGIWLWCLVGWGFRLIWWCFVASLVVSAVPLPGPLVVRYALGALIAMAGISVAVWVHESGHLIAGWLTGMRFVYCQAGPVVFARTISGIRFGWRGFGRYASGLACMVVEDERGFRWRDTLMTAGGPIASLLLACVMFYASTRLWLPAGDPTMDNQALRLLAIIATGHFLFSSIPVSDSHSSLTTDATLLRWLWTDPEGVDHVAASSVLTARVMAGHRPRDWDANLLDRASCDPWGSASSSGCRMLFYYHLDAGRLGEAEAALDMALFASDVPDVHLEAAFYHSLFGGDPVTARAQWTAAGDPADDLDASRVKAAVLLMEGDTVGSRAAAEEALKNLAWELGAGLAAAKEEWIRRILAECDAAPGCPSLSTRPDI